MICYVFLGEDFCACTHMLQVNLGDVVELVLIDEGYAYDVMHPFHLHGHSFYVVAMERHAEIPDHIGPAPGKYCIILISIQPLNNIRLNSSSRWGKHVCQ